MSFPVIIRPKAEHDLLQAQSWYDSKRAGLGTRFRNSVDNVLQILSHSPLIFPTIYRDVRRAALKHFPYILYYVFREERVLVTGCFHARRDPQIVLRRINRDSE